MMLQTSGQGVSEILTIYSSLRPTWFSAVWPHARNLFAYLAVIDFCAAAMWLYLGRHSLEEWASEFLRKTMILMIYYALLINGVDWIGAIISSFQLIGEAGAGTPGLSPGDIYERGLDIVGAIWSSMNLWGFIKSPAGAFATLIAAAVVFFAFTALSVGYVILMVESYLIVTGGLILLAFGGANWTRPYVERFFSFGVATGIKLMTFLLLVGTGLMLSNQWLANAKVLHLAQDPMVSAWNVMGSAVIFMAIVWQVPKLFASIMSGAPSLTAGDVTGIVAAPAAAATYFASRAIIRSFTKALQAAGIGKGTAAAASARQQQQRNLQAGSKVPSDVSPPAGGGRGGKTGGRMGAGSVAGTVGTYSAVRRNIPYEGSGQGAAPPRLPIQDDDEKEKGD